MVHPFNVYHMNNAFPMNAQLWQQFSKINCCTKILCDQTIHQFRLKLSKIKFEVLECHITELESKLVRLLCEQCIFFPLLRSYDNNYFGFQITPKFTFHKNELISIFSHETSTSYTNHYHDKILANMLWTLCRSIILIHKL